MARSTSAPRIARLAGIFAFATVSVFAGVLPASAASGGVRVLDYSQCANGKVPSTSLGCPGGWINGTLQGSNSHYREGEVTPQRAMLEVPKGTSAVDRTLTFRYQARKGGVADGIHAYDSLASWNFTQTDLTGDPTDADDRCSGVTKCPGGDPTTYPIPDDPTEVPPVAGGASRVTAAHMVPAGPGRVMTMYGGTLTDVYYSDPIHDNVAGATGDDYAAINVKYAIADANGDGKADADTVVQLLFGGHTAASIVGDGGWGLGLGSSNISGGPYHIKWAAADGESVGQRDNQIQGAAILPPALQIEKTSDAASVTAGRQIGFTITVTNPGGDARNVVLTDVLPTGTAQAGLSWTVAGTTGDPACSISPATGPSTQTLTCTKATMPGGSSFTVHVTSPTSGATGCTETTYNNTATVVADNNPEVQASASTTVNCPGLSVLKTADTPTVNAGEQVGFGITVTSTGPGEILNASLTDALPMGPGFNWTIVEADTAGSPTCSISADDETGAQTLNCSKAGMPANDSFHVHVISSTAGPANTCAADTYPNTAQAQATNHPQVTSRASVTVQCPALTVTKTADAASIDAGEQMGFVVVVSNAGPGAASNVTLTDALPAGAGTNWTIVTADTTGSPTCSISADAVTGAQTLNCSKAGMPDDDSFSVHVVSPTAGGGDTCENSTYPNTAQAQATNHPRVGGTSGVTVDCPGLQVSKTADNATVDAGEQIGFVITVTNTGTGNANNVTLTDALPKGAGVNWTIVVADTTGGPTCSIATNSETGAQTLTCSKPELAPNGSFSVHIVSATAGGGPECKDDTYPNTAKAQATNHPEVTGISSVQVNCPVLTATKTADADTVDAGEQIGFVVSMSNSGTGTANNASLTDALPSGLGVNWSIVEADTTGGPTCAISTDDETGAQTLTCSKTELGPGGSFSVHVISQTAGGGAACVDSNYPNTAQAQATNHPVVTAKDTVQVNCPVVTATKVADNATVDAGEQIGFVITVANSGTGNANNVTLTDALPTGPGIAWSIVDADTTGDPNCAISTNAVTGAQTLTCSKAELAPDSSFSVHIVSDTAGGGAECKDDTYPNTAQVRATNHPDLNPSSSVTVNCPVLVIVKTADASPVMGGLAIGFRITVSNSGAGNANSVSLSDALPVGPGINWTIVAADTTGDPTCAISTNTETGAQTLTCSKTELAPTSAFSVHITSPTSGGLDCITRLYSNTAQAQATNHPAQRSTATIQLDCPRLSVTKTQCPGNAVPGGYWPYTLGYANTGAVATTNTLLKDTIPVGTSVVSTGGGTQFGNTVSWSLGTLQPGASGSKTLVLLIGQGVAHGALLDNLVELTSDQTTAPPYHLLATVTTAGARTSASSYGLKVDALGGLVKLPPQNPRNTEAPGAKQNDQGEQLAVPANPDVSARVLRGTSQSRVHTAPDALGKSTSTATATVLDVKVLGGLVTADTVTGVSQTVASALGASYNSRGSRFQNLVVNNTEYTNVAPNTRVRIPDPLIPTDTIADVYLYEQGGVAGLSGNQWTSRHFVNMIRVVLLKPWRGLALGTEVIVSHAGTPSETPPTSPATSFPSGLACGPTPDIVSAKAYTAFVEGTLGGKQLALATYGVAEIGPRGGSDSNGTPTVIIPPATGTTLRTTTVGNSACGSVLGTNGCGLAAGSKLPFGSSRSVVHDTNILDGLITAGILDVSAKSTADGTTSPPTVLTAKFVDLKIAGLPIANTPAPNTVRIVDLPGQLKVEIRLNEQILNTTSSTSTAGTVNAIHVLVYSGSGAVIAEIIVASARSGARNL